MPEARKLHRFDVRQERATGIDRVSVEIAGHISTFAFTNPATAERVARSVVAEVATKQPDLIQNPLALAAAAAWLPQVVVNKLASDPEQSPSPLPSISERVAARDLVRLSNQSLVGLSASAADLAYSVYLKDLGSTLKAAAADHIYSGSVQAKAAPSMGLARNALHDLAASQTREDFDDALHRVDALYPVIDALVDSDSLPVAGREAAFAMATALENTLTIWGTAHEAAHELAAKLSGQILLSNGSVTAHAFLMTRTPAARLGARELERAVVRYGMAPTTDNLNALRAAVHASPQTLLTGLSSPTITASTSLPPGWSTQDRWVVAQAQKVIDAAELPLSHEEKLAAVATAINHALSATDFVQSRDHSKAIELLEDIAQQVNAGITTDQARLAAELMFGTQNLTALGALGLAQAELPEGHRPRPSIEDLLVPGPGPIAAQPKPAIAPAESPEPVATPVSAELIVDRAFELRNLGIPITLDTPNVSVDPASVLPRFARHPSELGANGSSTYVITGPASQLGVGTTATPLRITGNPGKPQTVVEVGNLRTENGILMATALFDDPAAATTLPQFTVTGQIFDPAPLTDEQAAYLAEHATPPESEEELIGPEVITDGPTMTTGARVALEQESELAALAPELVEEPAGLLFEGETLLPGLDSALAVVGADDHAAEAPATVEEVEELLAQAELPAAFESLDAILARLDPAEPQLETDVVSPAANEAAIVTEPEPAVIEPELVETHAEKVAQPSYRVSEDIFDDPAITAWAGPNASLEATEKLLAELQAKMPVEGEDVDPARAERLNVAVAHLNTAQESQAAMQHLAEDTPDYIKDAYSDAIASSTAAALEEGISIAPSPGEAEARVLADLHHAIGMTVSPEEFTQTFVAQLARELARIKTVDQAMALADAQAHGFSQSMAPGW